jgi:hypothetical protein
LHLFSGERVNEPGSCEHMYGRWATMPQGRKVGELHIAGRFAGHGLIPGLLAPGLTFCGRVLAEPLDKCTTVATERRCDVWPFARANAGGVDCPATGTGAGAIVCTCRAV